MRALPLLVAILAAGCTRGAPPAPPAPAPDTVRAARLPPPLSSVTIPSDVRYCIVRNGHLESVDVQIGFTGDAVHAGVPLSRAFPADSTYALNAKWYVYSGFIQVAGGLYVKYGLPRILAPTDVVPVAAYRGVTVFAEPAANPRRPEAIYIPVRPGCEFQPYVPVAKM